MADRCQSWRYHTHAKHPIPPAPGGCRHCWTSCNKIAPTHSSRCDECFELLITNPNPEVRRSIALEPGAGDDSLARLAEDRDYSVALTASNLVDQRRRAKEAVGLSSRNFPQFNGAPGAPKALPWAVR